MILHKRYNDQNKNKKQNLKSDDVRWFSQHQVWRHEKFLNTRWRHDEFLNTRWRHYEFLNARWRHDEFLNTRWRHDEFLNTRWRTFPWHTLHVVCIKNKLVLLKVLVNSKIFYHLILSTKTCFAVQTKHSSITFYGKSKN